MKRENRWRLLAWTLLVSGGCVTPERQPDDGVITWYDEIVERDHEIFIWDSGPPTTFKRKQEVDSREELYRSYDIYDVVRPEVYND
ncbi:MAG: hypothetical protein AAF492_03935 [Verrucomicrobiota bacterium]